jgi:hypothetical protein
MQIVREKFDYGAEREKMRRGRNTYSNEKILNKGVRDE